MSARLAAGTKLGRYEIHSAIGAGGMGEVYRARDTQLGRDVAVKVLPASFFEDMDRLHRFQQEACAASALNHPNIMVVHDIGAHDGSTYVVSELLDGETLRKRIGGTPLAQRRVIDYALQIARGLAAAHEKGIIHRDLKPDNIFITNDGRVKILDFGLAKLTQLDGNLAQTDIPTRRVDTDPGVVMGTVGYMAPEQLKGRNVDQRSDIFSFGAILYEMLSGRRAFLRESAAETMSAILKEDPAELSDTNKTVSPGLERLVNHCLEKNPEQRFHSARDLAFALESLSGGTVLSQQTETMPTWVPRLIKSRELIAWIVAGIAILAALTAFAMKYFPTPVDKRVLKLSILPQQKTDMGMTGATPMAISPEGRRLAFIANSSGKDLVWVRPLDSLSAQALAGTDGVFSPSNIFWSPESRSIGFFAGGKLKKIDASGGPPQTLCDAPDGRGGTWNSEGVILFNPSASNQPIFRVSAAGGNPTPVTSLDTAQYETSHRWPYFLPDGRHFIFFVRGRSEHTGVYVASLDSKDTRQLVAAPVSGLYAPPGWLLFMRNETLMAQLFDANELRLSGEPISIAERVSFNGGLGRGSFSVSENGVLVYRGGGSQVNQPLWFDRTGKQLGSLGEAALYFTLWLSPDGKRAAADRMDSQTGTQDIWLFDLLRGIPSRFTTDPANDWFPLWSPDGNSSVFSSNREGVTNLFLKNASGVGDEEVLLKSDENKTADDWSADGKFIVYDSRNTQNKADLWILPMEGDRKPFPFLQTVFNELQAQFSPDGKWLAYTSDESGTPEVYVQTFPASGGKWRISTTGGAEPQWRRDGKELFYLGGDKKLMAVEIKQGTAFEAGVPKALFETRVLALTTFRNHYVVTADGQRFLINSGLADSDYAPISVVVNWTEDLKR
jgi:serine/threonine protein kinase